MMIPHLGDIKDQIGNSNEELDNMREFQQQSIKLMLDFKTLLVSIASIIEKSFVGDMLRGLDIMVKFLSHWQILVPLLAVAAYFIGQIAALSIIASLANPLTAPAAIGALAVGGTLLGASLLGALSKGNDTNSNMTQNNSINIDGSDNPQKTAKTVGDHLEKMFGQAEYQSPQYSY